MIQMCTKRECKTKIYMEAYNMGCTAGISEEPQIRFDVWYNGECQGV